MFLDAYHPKYEPEREQLQDPIITEQSRGGRGVPAPRIIFLTGPIGVGKTYTFDKLVQAGYLDPGDFLRLDADRIKDSIPEYAQLKATDPETAATRVHAESGYIQELAMLRGLRDRKNLVVEGSLLNTIYYQALMTQIRKSHPEYILEIVNVGGDVEQIREQARRRAYADGRVEPADKLERTISGATFAALSLEPWVDRFVTVDNSAPDGPNVLSIRGPDRREVLTRPGPMPLNPRFGSRSRLRRALGATFPFAHESPGSFDLVLDLDWTLLNELRPGDAFDPARDLDIDGRRFRVSRGAAMAIADLLWRFPKLRVSFYSGGSRSRNLKALKRIELPDGSGRTLFDVAYRLASVEDFVPGKTGKMPGLKFSERMHKFLGVISPHTTRIVLADDVRHFATPRERKNTIWLGRTYNVYSSYEDVKKDQAAGGDQYFVPATEEIYERDLHKIAGVYAIVREALEDESAGRGNFRDLVAEKQSRPRAGYISLGRHQLGAGTQRRLRECLGRGLTP